MMIRMKVIIGQVLLACLVIQLAGCEALREIEGVPPVVFADVSPLSRQLGRVGIVRQGPEISIDALTDSQLFRKEAWNKIAQGALTGLQWFNRELQPMSIVAIGCLDSKKQCRETKIVVGSLALVAMAVGGVAGGSSAEYSDNLVREMKGSLLQEVRDVNDHLQSTILADANARVFDRAYGVNRSDDWAKHAFAALEAKPFIEVNNRRAAAEKSGDTVGTPDGLDIESVLDATVVQIHFTDDEAWLSPKVELRVEAMTRITLAKDGKPVDERRYECVSVPRSIRYWSTDSYRHVRDEITFCTHLLGRQIASELLEASIGARPR